MKKIIARTLVLLGMVWSVSAMYNFLPQEWYTFASMISCFIIGIIFLIEY